MLRIINYSPADIHIVENATFEDLERLDLHKYPVTWIEVTGPTHEEIEHIADKFGLHALTIEDAIKGDQRPKIEEFPNYTFAIVKPLFLTLEGHLAPVDLNVFVMPDYLITISDAELPQLEEVKRRIKKCMPHLRENGTEFLFHAILDAVVDSYFFVLDRIEDDIEDVEDKVVIDPSPQVLEKINGLKRDLLIFRRNVWPLRDILSLILSGYYPFISEKSERYYRDISDHVARLIDLDETYRELVSSARDSYLSSVSYRMNEVVQRLTVVATIVLPLSLIAGIYGMNFEHMPELRHPYGYFIVLGIMATIAIIMLSFFRREGYI